MFMTLIVAYMPLCLCTDKSIRRACNYCLQYYPMSGRLNQIISKPSLSASSIFEIIFMPRTHNLIMMF